MIYKKNYFKIVSVVMFVLLPFLSTAQGNSCGDPIDLNVNYPIDGNGSYQIPVDNSQSSQFYTYTADKIGTLKMWSGFAYASGDPTFETDLKVYQTSCDNLIADIDSSPGLLGNCEFEVDVEIGDTYIFEWSNHNWAGEFKADYFFQEPVDAISCGNPTELTIGTNEHNAYFKTQYFEFTAPYSGVLELSTCGFENAYGIYEFELSSDCQNELTSSFNWDCDPDENYDWFTQEYTMVEGETITVATPDRLHSLYNFNASFPIQGEACQIPFDLIILPEDLHQVPHACTTCRIDKWYKFTAPKSGPGIVTTGQAALASHGGIGGQEQTHIKVYSICDGEPIAENDDYYQFFGSSLVSIDFQEGETYYIEFVAEFINDSYYFDIFYEEDLLFGTEEAPLDVTLGLNDSHANMYYAGEQHAIGEQWFTYEFSSEGAFTMGLTQSYDRQTIIFVISDNDYQFAYPDEDSGPDGFIMEGVAGAVVKFGLSRTNNTFSASFKENCEDDNVIVNKSVCESFEFDGVLLKSSGDYSATFMNQAGCDSLVALSLTILESDDVSKTRTVCDSFEFNGVTLDASGEYDGVFMNEAGCDSLVALSLTILESDDVSETRTVCDSFEFNGVTLDTSGEYDGVFMNKEGCDSLVALTLTVLDSDEVFETQTACNSYDFAGTSITESGEYNATFLNQAGCDSLVNLTLEILQSSNSTITTSSCALYEFGGEQLVSSGDYYHTFTNIAGCDSLVSLNFTLLESDETNLTTAACEEYLFGAESLTSSGRYESTYQNQAGCDSLVVLDQTILQSDRVELATEVCESYAFDELDLSESGIYESTFTNQAGCDSLVVLDLTILQDAICDPNEVILAAADETLAEVRLYPNPTTDYVTVELPRADSQAEISLLTMTGQMIQSLRVQSPNSAELSLPSTTGVYLVRIIYANGLVELRKVIRQ